LITPSHLIKNNTENPLTLVIVSGDSEPSEKDHRITRRWGNPSCVSNGL
jgi:hypothetical protein